MADLFVDGVAEASVVGYRPKEYILTQIQPFLKTPKARDG